MPGSATDMGILSRRYSSAEMEHDAKRCPSARQGLSVVSSRSGPRLWSVVVLSILGSAAVVAAVGCLCALLYPILEELRAERVSGQDGTERMLDFWSILVLSALAGCVCFVFSRTLTHLDSSQPGIQRRDAPGHGFDVGCDVAVLNGIMGSLTVAWSLT